MPYPNFTSWQDKRADDLNVGENPSNWFWFQDPQKTHTDFYKLSTALEFADAADKYGIDPYDFIALGISESGLGNLDPGNPARVYWNKHPELVKKLTKGDDSGNLAMMVPEDQARALSLDFAANLLSEKFKKYPDDRLKALQAYSGLGKTLYGGNPDVVQYHLNSKNVFGGRPYDSIDYGKEKPQAKRVARLSELLKVQPEIVSLLNNQKQFTLNPKQQPRQKGPGYFGKLSRPDGKYSTELSTILGVDGKDIEMPLLVPGLSQDNLAYLLSGEPEKYPGNVPQDIKRKAIENALYRRSIGLSPFAYNPFESSGAKAVPIGETGIIDPLMRDLAKYLGQPIR